MKKSSYVIPAIIAVIVLFFSVNSSSIWIDEMITYQTVHDKSFLQLLQEIWSANGAGGGMPLYFIFEWMWTQLFGYSEIAMRSINILFAIIYFIVSWRIIRKTEAPSWFCVLFFLNPLFLYYMNEARPYAMLLCIGSIYTYLLFFCNLNKYKTLFALHFVFLIGSLTHMMFMFIILMYFVQCIRLYKIGEFKFKEHLSVMGAFALPYIAVLYHYLTVMSGASEIGGVGNLGTNWKASIAQIVYYFVGLGGLGLSRNDLRAMLFSQLSWVHIACILFLFFGYLMLFIHFVKYKLWKDKFLTTTFWALLTCFGVFCVMNILFQTRFWERHVIYLLPALLILLCVILKSMVDSKKQFPMLGAMLVICMISFSGLRIMFDKYHQKEDYKGISAYVSNTDAETVFLQGDSLIYTYYGIDMSNPKYRMINNLGEEELKDASSDKLLVLSSREEFDAEGLYPKMYEAREAKYNSFIVVRYNP
ncbi:hypothetical protein D0T50_07860 [Bacteroides sp. 214]|uniref:glycosyltransferase family 39 protein n=1 Tax=Bacteroides sp. 214 TaxID=2302935 RepID=UPI0013D362DF|nr:glycosyltransferase family 39 protein [Bacteroides sp. 214]NDW12804.1 hypothetical protein [Bacteroides sp. 214]